jgi:3',5'-cyclic AMP phosphodiesterase CpdA
VALVLFHVSDLHFGFEDRAALDWFMADVERERPAAVLCTGDLTMRGTAREFAMAREWLTALPVPLTLEPGNHDVPYYWYPLARVFHPWRHYDALAAAVEAEPDLPDLAIVSLRSVAAAQWRLNWSKGRVGTSDLDGAVNDLERHRARPLKLVTTHHPLVDADTEGSGSTRGGKRALAALARAGADAVLSGHVHDPFDLTVDAGGLPIRLIGAGTLSQRLRATPPSYNRLEWSADAGLAVTPQTMP